jgi:NAD(P)-dependent dehydrogenase (short-subunit alcohol dehydrogenase family)
MGLGSLRTMHLDMANLSSIEQFSDQLHHNYNAVDYLILNAGSAPPSGSVSSDGLELSIASMHFGNAALVEWIQDLLISPSTSILSIDGTRPHRPSRRNSRVIIVGSVAFTMGAFHDSLMNSNDGGGDFRLEVTDNCAKTGPFNVLDCCPLMACPATNGYARSKLANILYLKQLQKKLDQEAYTHYGSHASNLEESRITRRRVVTASLHPGSVSTAIHPLMESTIAAFFLRSGDQSAHVVLHALFYNNFITGAYIYSMKRPHNIFEFDSELHEAVELHASAYPVSLFSNDLLHQTSGSLPKWLPKRIRDTVEPPSEVVEGLTIADPNEIFSFEQWYFRKFLASRMVFSVDATGKVSVSDGYSASVVQGRLWDVTSQTIHGWVAGMRNNLLLGEPKLKRAPRDGLGSKYDDL